MQYTKRMKGRNHVTISTNTKKSFDKIKCPFVIETFNKLGVDEK